jgi:hypothetical protein
METARLVWGRQPQSITRWSDGKARCAWLSVSLLFLLTSLANSQLYTGSISGTVTDPSGAVIPSASVSAIDSRPHLAISRQPCHQPRMGRARCGHSPAFLRINRS